MADPIFNSPILHCISESGTFCVHPSRTSGPLVAYSSDFDNACTYRTWNLSSSVWLQTTQPTSGGAVTANSSCCANCVEPPRPQQWGPDLPFFGQAGHADPLDGWRCCSQKRVMSRPIQVRQLKTRKSGFVISAINKYMSESRYP